MFYMDPRLLEQYAFSGQGTRFRTCSECEVGSFDTECWSCGKEWDNKGHRYMVMTNPSEGRLISELLDDSSTESNRSGYALTK